MLSDTSVTDAQHMKNSVRLGGHWQAPKGFPLAELGCAEVRSEGRATTAADKAHEE